MSAAAIGQTPLTAPPKAKQFQTDCDAYEGKAVKFSSVHEIIRELSSIKKNEFETDAQYLERANVIRKRLGKLVVVKTKAIGNLFVYDADIQEAYVNSKAFGFDKDDTATTAAALLNLDIFSKMHDEGRTYIVSKQETNFGTYNTFSIFGRNVRVTRRLVHYTMVYAFDSVPADEAWDIHYSIEEAKLRRQTAKPAFLLDISKAAAFEGKQRLGEPSLTSPVDLTERYSVLFGEILCGFFYVEGSSGKGAKIVDTFNWESEDE